MLRSASLIALLSLGMPLSAQSGPGNGCCQCMRGQFQAGSKAPIASNPVVDISGVVGQVQIAPGQGMPYLEVKHGSETTKVYLGSMRYLIAQDFSPKTGQDVTVKGYKQAEDLIAIQVTLPKENKTLKLRDDNGWPLWRGGPWRGHGRRMGGGPPGPPK